MTSVRHDGQTDKNALPSIQVIDNASSLGSLHSVRKKMFSRIASRKISKHR